MADIRQLASQLHEIAWSAVRRPAADPWGSAAGTREERRTGSLELLAVYSQLVKVLQRRIDLTIKDALDAGADYGQVAAACGVSRQAVRQRWMRRTAGPRWYEVRLPYPRPRSWTGRPPGGEPAPAVVVRLAGGPHDGGRDFASPGEILMYEADGPSPDPPGYVPLLAWYVPSQDDANVYVFAGAERDLRRRPTWRDNDRGAQAGPSRAFTSWRPSSMSAARSSWTSSSRWVNSYAQLLRLSSTPLRKSSGNSFIRRRIANPVPPASWPWPSHNPVTGRSDAHLGPGRVLARWQISPPRQDPQPYPCPHYVLRHPERPPHSRP